MERIDEDAQLKLVIDALKKRYDLIAVILFGSRARKDHKPWSDYDLLIIADFESPYLERISEVLEVLKDIRLPIEPHPYTLEEAINMLKRGNPTIYDALDEGIVLYETDKFQQLKKLFIELKRRGMKRTAISIIIPQED